MILSFNRSGYWSCGKGHCHKQVALRKDTFFRKCLPDIIECCKIHLLLGKATNDNRGMSYRTYKILCMYICPIGRQNRKEKEIKMLRDLNGSSQTYAMHYELRDTMARVGVDIKRRLLDDDAELINKSFFDSWHCSQVNQGNSLKTLLERGPKMVEVLFNNLNSPNSQRIVCRDYRHLVYSAKANSGPTAPASLSPKISAGQLSTCAMNYRKY